MPPGGLKNGRFGRKPWGKDDDFPDIDEDGETCDASTEPDEDQMHSEEEG